MFLFCKKYPEVKVLDQMVVLFSIFLKKHHTVFIVSESIFSPTNNAQGSFLTISSPTLTCYLFDDSHSYRCKVVSRCGCFHLHSSDNLRSWVSFHVFVGHLHVLFGKMSIQILCPFLNQAVGLFDVELCKFFVYSRYDPSSHMSVANIFFYSIGCIFILLTVSFTVQKVLVWCYLICLSLLLFCLPEETNQCVIKGCDASSIVLDLKVALATRDLLCFHTNFRIIHPSSVKNATGIILTL